MSPPRARCWPFLVTLVALPALAQVTESPYTVAPGRVLLEMDGVRLSLDRESDARFTGVGVASTLLSVGIAERFDVQAGVDLFLKETLKVGGERDSSSGIGDLAFRMKWTVWQDERLGAALAVIPYARFPSGTGGVGADRVEGGVVVPWEMKVAGGVIAGAMLQADVVRNDDEDGYDSHVHATGFLQREITRAFGVYGEATALVSSGGSGASGTVGIGALLQVSKTLQLDYELQRGVNRRASDWMHVLRLNYGW